MLPVFSPLGLVLWVAAIVLVAKSLKKLRTFLWMVGASLGVMFLFVLWGPILHMGDPRASVSVGSLVALLVAVIAGLLHMRSSKRATTEK